MPQDATQGEESSEDDDRRWRWDQRGSDSWNRGRPHPHQRRHSLLLPPQGQEGHEQRDADVNRVGSLAVLRTHPERRTVISNHLSTFACLKTLLSSLL